MGKIIKWTILILILTAILFYGAKIISLKNSTQDSSQTFISKIKEGASALQNLNTGKAISAFRNAKNALDGLQNSKDLNSATTILSLGENLIPNLKKIPLALNDLADFTNRLISVSENLDLLEHQAFHMAFSGDGIKIIKALKILSSDLKNISELATRLSGYAQNFNIPLPNDYLALMVKLNKTESIIQSLTDYLNSPGAKHLAILLQNPSEIRPSGGFIGSFVALIIEDASITGIDVKDIYDVDGQLTVKILPPRPLQKITSRWGARDANWFFDFPTSAEKVLSFLNQSKIYSEQNLKFTGAIAINVPVLQDILEVIGNINLPTYKLTINKDNFLSEIQREVESGVDNKNGHPKKILGSLAPLILSKLSNLDDQAKLDLVKKLGTRINHKDIAVYFEDRSLETYAQNEGMGGEIYGSETQMSDDYLALVNANIGGGKTDAFVKEKISLNSFINYDGKISNTLSVERSHEGNVKQESWYRAKNKIFMQILSPSTSKLLNIKGQDAKTPTSPSMPKTYQTDPDLSAIENSIEWLDGHQVETMSQFGKNTFALYWTIYAGDKKTLTANYEINNHFIPSNGGNFRFVYEKQSGVPAEFEYSISTPPGFIWHESGTNQFKFSNPNPETRIILDLTLEKI